MARAGGKTPILASKLGVGARKNKRDGRAAAPQGEIRPD